MRHSDGVGYFIRKGAEKPFFVVFFCKTDFGLFCKVVFECCYTLKVRINHASIFLQTFVFPTLYTTLHTYTLKLIKRKLKVKKYVFYIGNRNRK